MDNALRLCFVKREGTDRNLWGRKKVLATIFSHHESPLSRETMAPISSQVWENPRLFSAGNLTRSHRNCSSVQFLLKANLDSNACCAFICVKLDRESFWLAFIASRNCEPFRVGGFATFVFCSYFCLSSGLIHHCFRVSVAAHHCHRLDLSRDKSSSPFEANSYGQDRKANLGLKANR